MKDWPITYRIALLAALLFCLSLILRQFFVDGGGLALEEVPLEEGAGGVRPAFTGKSLYPPVPAVMPDLNDNYLFNSERSFAGDELDAGFADEMVDLAEVTYTGSLIVGNIRMGLITYQDDVPVAGATAPPARRGAAPPRNRTKTVARNKQLAVGDDFMGYLVEKIEKDRLVLKKGDEMIEKFLYDSGKDRAGVGQAIRTLPGENLTVPARQPDNVRRDSSLSRQPAPADSPPSKVQTIRSRSELLRGLDPNLGVPPSRGGGPGDPLRR